MVEIYLSNIIIFFLISIICFYNYVKNNTNITLFTCVCCLAGAGTNIIQLIKNYF